MFSLRSQVTHLSQMSLRNVSTSSVSMATSYYEVLGIQKSSTQADIKASYYKLSKIYHPDVNSDEEAAIKFRAITAAYEVLGNIKLKKLYDRGVYQENDDSEINNTPSSKFDKSRVTRHRVPSDLSASIYDYDGWVKEHYGATFDRDRERRERVRTKTTKVVMHRDGVMKEKIYIAIAVLLVLLVVLAEKRKHYDVDTTTKEK